MWRIPQLKGWLKNDTNKDGPPQNTTRLMSAVALGSTLQPCTGHACRTTLSVAPLGPDSSTDADVVLSVSLPQNQPTGDHVLL